MLAWSEGTDNGRQKTRNHGYDVIVGGELFDYSDHPSQTCHAKPKTQINGRRTPVSRWWDAYRKLPTAERLLSSVGAWRGGRLRSVALYL